ncbi:FAD-dependent monooxygenase [Nonomuraea fuscirosea]
MDDPVVRHVLDSLEDAPDHLFDSVHQVRMSRWSKGRVVLVGDAAWCMNLYSGMGATSSLRGGAALSAALREHPDDLATALDAWEARLRPFITKHQRTARLKQQMFVPSSRRAEALRSVLLGLVRRIRGRRPATGAGGPRARAMSGTSR